MTEDQLKDLHDKQKSIRDLQQTDIVDQATHDKAIKDKGKETAQAARDRQKEMTDALYGTLVKNRELENKAKIDSIKNEDEKAKETLRIQQQASREELAHSIKAFDEQQVQRNEDRKRKGESALAATKEEIAYRNSLVKEQGLLAKSQAIEMQNLVDAQNKARLEKERQFQTEILDIKNQTAVMGIQNLRDRAREELQIEIDKQIAEVKAADATVMTQDQKDQKIAALTEQNHAKKKALEDGFATEDQQNHLGYLKAQVDDERIII